MRGLKLNKYKLIAKGAMLDAFGGTNEEILKNTIETNIFNVDLDCPIYRIFQLKHFLRDIKNKTLTYCKPSPEAWGDDYEAFLSRVKFFISNETSSLDPECAKQYQLTMEPALDNYFALCWTSNQAESKLAWDDFSYGGAAVRIKTTPRNLLQSVINLNDNCYTFSHFLGAICYMPDHEFEELFTNTHYQEYLDSLGHGLAKSFFILGESYKHEQEVRLLYVHHPSDNDWVKKNVEIKGDICAIPFDWQGIIDEIVICPDGISDSKLNTLNNTLQKANIVTDVCASKFTR